MGNVFARKRHAGIYRPDQIFRFHWRDDPRKTEAWAVLKKSSLAATPNVWAAEYDIDYTASVEGVCIPATWVDAAIRLMEYLGGQVVRPASETIGGFDVGGGGRGKSVFIARSGPLVHPPKVRSNPNTIDTAYWAIAEAIEAGCVKMNYDNIGVGTAVTSVLMNEDPETAPPGRDTLRVVGINAGDSASTTVWPDGRTSDKFIANLKAEGWWLMRNRFQASFEHMNFLIGSKSEVAIEHPIDDLILLPNDPNLRMQIGSPRVFYNEKGKILMESKEQMRSRGISSPDHADALVLTFMPDPEFTQAGFYAMIKAQLARMAAQGAGEESAAE